MTLEAFECSTGRSIAAADAKAERKEDVLKALGGVTSIVRQKLGETPLQQFDLPIEQATTPSLEALQAYTLGRAERAKGKEIESIPFFRRALELDPDFAAAHTMSSTVYGVLGELGQSEEHARDAYARRDHVSERERYLITYQVPRPRHGRSARVPAHPRPLEGNISARLRSGQRASVLDLQPPRDVRARHRRSKRSARPAAGSSVSACRTWRRRIEVCNNLAESRRWAQRAIDLEESRHLPRAASCIRSS